MDKNKVWWAIAGVILLIGVAFAFVFLSNKDQPESVEVPTQNTTQTAEPTQPSNQVQVGTYQPYSQQAFNDSTAQHKILFFHAEWCPQCRALEKSIEQNGVPANVAIFKVD